MNTNNSSEYLLYVLNRFALSLDLFSTQFNGTVIDASFTFRMFMSLMAILGGFCVALFYVQHSNSNKVLKQLDQIVQMVTDQGIDVIPDEPEPSKKE